MKKIIAILCLSLMFCSTVHATETTTQVATQATTQATTEVTNPDVINAPIMSYAKITTSYSTGIAIEDSDVFTIKVRSQSTNEVYAIDVNAKSLAGKIGKLDLAVGTYTVESVEYLGSNVALLEQGFSINTQFDVVDDINTTGTIYIYIGKETSEILQKKTQFFAYYLNGQPTVLETTTETQIVNPETESTTEYTPEAVTEETTEEIAPKQHDTNEFTKFKPAKLIPVMIIFIIGALIIYTLKRNGKL